MNYKVLVAASLAAMVVRANAVDESVPEPWFKNGQPPASNECKAGVDPDLENQGTPNLTLKCDESGEGFVGIMQNFSAVNYRGKRVRYSALVKSESVEGGWGGLWMRVDDINRPNASFDNMQNRGIVGTSGWTPYSIVLDVSANAHGIFFGTLLSGAGQLWVSDVRFEVVDDDTPVTGREMAPEPMNLELAR